MANRFYMVVVAALLAISMWFWVQNVAIPHQQSESRELGIPRGNLSDLYPRWLGARELLLRGRDPYSAEITREIQAGYYGRPLDPTRPNDPKDQQAFAYPLYVVFVLAPSVGLPFSFVRQVFFWLLVFLTAVSVPLWLRALGWRVSCTACALWIVLTVGCFPAVQGFKLQQLTLLVAFLLAASLCAAARGYFIPAGILLALATIKPQLVALPVAWLCIWAVGHWRVRQRLIWSFACTMLALTAAGEFLLPGWIHEFRQASADYWRYTGGGRSVLDVLLTPALGRGLSVLLVVAALLSLWRLRRSAADTADFAWSLAVVMATTLAVIPMFAPYNQLLLLPAVMLAARAARPLWQAGRLPRFLVAVTAISIAWPWLASAVLVIAMLFLTATTVQRAWTLPLYTNFAIPLTTLALLLACRTVLRQQNTAPNLRDASPPE